jgi:hypothetical protein
VGVFVGVRVGVKVRVGVLVGVRGRFGVRVAVGVRLAVGVRVGVGWVGVMVGVRVGDGVLVGVGVGGKPEHPFRALFTASMIKATFTSAPLGTPLGHADGWAVPSAMFTSVMISSMVTALSWLQSPTSHGGPGELYS